MTDKPKFIQFAESGATEFPIYDTVEIDPAEAETVGFDYWDGTEMHTWRKGDNEFCYHCKIQNHGQCSGLVHIEDEVTPDGMHYSGHFVCGCFCRYSMPGPRWHR